MLALVLAMSKCRLYLAGLHNFTLKTDNHPLIPILNYYSLDAIENPRLQRLKEKISLYLFTAVWHAGKSLNIPDALSRAPVSHPTPEDEIAGFPSNKCDLLNSLLPYWKIRDELYADGDLVLYGARVIVPATLRCRTLSRLHNSHRGMEATKSRVRQAVFWPGINSDIVNTIEACESCQVLQPTQQQKPLMNDNNPTRPFESVSADFFTIAGKAFLLIADRLSGWPVVVPCKGDTAASNTIRIFCRYFQDVGVPLCFRTDGGPQ
ncbi:uncharacterized protein K02A2.6-like [Macrobrachium nipponense]|uniref:uncharacterized protein K02A2.6-like n=1 Tax=Macrobrachium nipponense TaxID=159736 RepID=UPI0030C8B4E2